MMKKLYKKYYDKVGWLLHPISFGIGILLLISYYFNHYCVEKEGKCRKIECVRSHEELRCNGKATWKVEICDEEKEIWYDCIYNDCGCTKIK